ncbi:sigma-70 family RNA polymerase sigma factor [Paludisphaera mucosa]|uniref:Sigma-70 family RNA polymerase sigma factor n=1 Tax=Paludisphaera mucosa TaxID=3030827 RepID=A0ABT6FLC1_9BACT|nr:sigma-70 family RNA polymerase sigma factor [Paludisphaera mucosa]MDG3008158.1 sigma-70 family RNA polymerase sigma factor [Paludisphaera mucosa]
MGDESTSADELIRRVGEGDEEALGELFGAHRERLKRLVRLRLDRRLQRRVDPSDVLQEAYLDLAKKLPAYASKPSLPFFLWVRLVVVERLIRIHRTHLDAAARDAGREVSLHRGGEPRADSASIAAQLLGRVTSASRAAVRAERRVQLEATLDAMDPVDREVIVLRHFEELSNDEAASVLGLSKAAASKRYVRAMLKLKVVLANTPGLADTVDGGAG